MKKFLLLMLLLFAIFVAIYRQRLFLWDPIATVTRDGEKDSAARVRINFTNDVLLEDPPTQPAGHTRLYLIQNWSRAVIAPARLTCLGRAACMTDADQASGIPIPAGSRGRREPFVGVTMTNKRIEFVDEDGALIQVLLR